MVRLDAGSAGTELSWSVAVQWRGQGLGRAIVAKALDLVSDGGYVFATIHEQNIRSRRIAEASGMIVEFQRGPWVRYFRGKLNEVSHT